MQRYLAWAAIAVAASLGCRSNAPAQAAARRDAGVQVEVVAGKSKPIDIEHSWTSSADDDGSSFVRQESTDARHCTVEAHRAGQVIWSMRECVATIGQKRLVSPDAEALLVLDESPFVEGYPAETQVATLIRRGAVERKLVAGDFDPNGRAFRVSSSRIGNGSLQWLAPNGVSVDAEGVHLSLANEKSALISWDGAQPARSRR